MSHYYRNTITEVRKLIQEKYPAAKSDENGLAQNDMPSYILWMVSKIDEMDALCDSAALKAARWLGWILRVVEADLHLWDNIRSRDLVRSEVKENNDKPRG